jgi:Xaa-Pro dipeptidase
VVLLKVRGVLELVEFHGLEVLVVESPANVTYLTGLPRSSGTVLLVWRDGRVLALTPALDYWRVLNSVKGVEVLPYATYSLPDFEVTLVEPPHTYIPKLLKSEGVSRVGSDSPYTRVSAEVGKALDVEVRDFSEVLADLRAVKTPEELELMRRALAITEKAVEEVLGEVRVGTTEKTIAALVEYRIKLGGAEGLAFESIVASGPNSSYPHATVTDRVIGSGEPVTIDVGARFREYCSDLTRTVLVGPAPAEVRRVLELVAEAVDEATDAVKEGVTSEEVDTRAREVIRRAGLGRYFIHSLGHGVGVEVHERPRLAQGSKEVLREGMVVTIEPGVYVPGRFGVRIENMVLVTKTRGEILNRLSKIV